MSERYMFAICSSSATSISKSLKRRDKITEGGTRTRRVSLQIEALGARNSKFFILLVKRLIAPSWGAGGIFGGIGRRVELAGNPY